MRPDRSSRTVLGKRVGTQSARSVQDLEGLRVRISSQDRGDEVRLAGTPLGVQVFVRDGNAVHSSAGGHAASFEVEPRPGGEGLGVAGRIYPGKLLVEPHGAHGLRVTNLVALEDYIAGVVPAELVLWSAEPAEIEAQAIAARTYALRSLVDRMATTREAFLWDDTRDQVYVGIFSAGSSSGAQRVQARLERALEASRNQVLVDERGVLYDVRFHASCGGHTTSPANAFPLESSVTSGAVACTPCQRIGAEERGWSKQDERPRRVHWSWTASRSDLQKLASALDIGRSLRRMRVTSRDDYGRWLRVELEGDASKRDIDVTRLRAELDPAKLKSGLLLRTWPTSGGVLEDGALRGGALRGDALRGDALRGDLITGGLLFEGLGRGHGAGLCQVGSHDFATRGWSARQILTHYLADAHLITASDMGLASQTP